MSSKKNLSTGWRKVSSGQFWKPTEVGESRIGEIMGFRSEETKFGISAVCDLADTETGEMFSVWSSSADLRPMNRMPVGQRVRLEYQGEQRIPGRKQMKEGYLVQIPADARLDSKDWFLEAGHSYDRSKSKKKTAKRRKTA